MCHPDVPAGTATPRVRTEEATIALPGREPIPAYLALPSALPAPGVLVIPDMYGRSPFYDHICARLAEAGMIAVQPDIFHREGPLPRLSFDAAMERRRRLDGVRCLGELSAVIDWTAGREDCTGRVGTLGFCAGGTFALNLAADRDDLATVAYYAFPDGGKGRSSSEPPTPLEVADRMHGPILAFWGDQDAAVGMDSVTALRSTLQAAEVKHEIHVYPGLAHGFLKQLLEDEEAEGHAQAAEAWARTLSFLSRRLGVA
jgi:dienelactone hydrolase